MDLPCNLNDSNNESRTHKAEFAQDLLTFFYKFGFTLHLLDSTIFMKN